MLSGIYMATLNHRKPNAPGLGLYSPPTQADLDSQVQYQDHGTDIAHLVRYRQHGYPDAAVIVMIVGGRCALGIIPSLEASVFPQGPLWILDQWCCLPATLPQKYPAILRHLLFDRCEEYTTFEALIGLEILRCGFFSPLLLPFSFTIVTSTSRALMLPIHLIRH